MDARRFSGEVKDGFLYGRGAVDMKGGIACSVAAVLQYLADNGGKPKGSISFLITGDEEDISVNGTIKLLKWGAERGEKFDHCVLGEPSNVEVLGDCIKVGRRGSQSGTLYVDGVQGHVAYPHRASNPVPDISRLIVALCDEPLDHGSAQFQASNLEFTSVDVGNTASNVIPGQARAKFNIRFNDHHTQESCGSWSSSGWQRPAATGSAPGSCGSRPTPTCSSPNPAPSPISRSARSRR